MSQAIQSAWQLHAGTPDERRNAQTRPWKTLACRDTRSDRREERQVVETACRDGTA